MLEQGGIEAVKTVSKDYEEKVRQIQSGSLTNKKLALKPNYEEMKKCLTEGNESGFHDQLSRAIQVINTSVDI